MPGSDASHASSLTEVVANLVAATGNRKNESRSIFQTKVKPLRNSLVSKTAREDLDRSCGDSDEGSRGAQDVVHGDDSSRTPLHRKTRDKRNAVPLASPGSPEIGRAYANMLRDRVQGYHIVSMAHQFNTELNDGSDGRLATHAEIMQDFSGASISSEDELDELKAKSRSKSGDGAKSEGNRAEPGEQKTRSNSVEAFSAKSEKSNLDNGRKKNNAKDNSVYIIRNSSNGGTSSSFGAGSLMDAEDLSLDMSDSESIDSFVHDAPMKSPLGCGDTSSCAAIHKCSSPPPSCAESTSNSSSSSNESKMEPCTELPNGHGNANSIFRGRSYSNASGSRRITNQDSGANSLLSRSEALSMSSERLGTNDGDKGKGPWVSFTPLRRIPYVHGSYSTAAPMMLHDTKWMRILRHLMPESHADAVTMLCQELKAGSIVFPNAVRVMKWAENNPVVAAYGMMNSDGGRGKGKRERRQASKNDSATYSPRLSMSGAFGRPPKTTSAGQQNGSTKSSQTRVRRKPMLEWDVFLDPNLVRKVDAALRAADETRQTCRYDEVAQVAAEVEVDRQVGRLISRMVLAHGSTSQLVAEAVGFIPQHNFASVVEQGESQRLHRRRRKLKRDESLSRSGLINAWQADRVALARRAENHIVPFAPGKGSAKGAGIFIERWMAIFATALRLAEENGRIDDSESLSNYGKLLDDLEQDVEIRQVKPTMCGMFLCLGYEDPNSTKADHSKTSMATSAKEVQQVLGSPLGVVLDLKSRRVPPRVWARLVDTLRSRSIEVGGLGSFDVEELRSISSFCTTPVTGVIFFHSAGDLQRACHSKEVKRGDTVYFNAGSLILPKPNIIAKISCCKSEHYLPDTLNPEEEVVFQPYAYPRHKIPKSFRALECKSTLRDYQRWFDLNIGVYVQEFSISDRTLDAISKLVNDNPTIYNLGLAWGGINGKTSPGVPGDGYWNQRYMGRSWDLNAEPTDAMNLLHIEDHHLVKKAFRAGAWGHIGMVNPVNDVGGDATGDGASLNFEPCRPIE